MQSDLVAICMLLVINLSFSIVSEFLEMKIVKIFRINRIYIEYLRVAFNHK